MCVIMGTVKLNSIKYYISNCKNLIPSSQSIFHRHEITSYMTDWQASWDRIIVRFQNKSSRLIIATKMGKEQREYFKSQEDTVFWYSNKLEAQDPWYNQEPLVYVLHYLAWKYVVSWKYIKIMTIQMDP